MRSTTHRAEIEALFQQADVIVEAYAPEAVIDDLVPLLGRCGIVTA